MTEITEPKRRGRPPKIELTEAPDVPEVAPSDEFLRRKAQNYANRVWAGQSLSLNRAERLARVQAALEAQGLSMEGVTL